MRKVFTIAVALMLLLTGMHITVATHFCAGELAATRVSVTGELASCGMVQDEISNSSAETSFKSNCCENEFSIYSVESNYAPSVFHFKEITQNIFHELYIPVGYSFQSNFSSIIESANTSPPDFYLANAVSMANICVFRI